MPDETITSQCHPDSLLRQRPGRSEPRRSTLRVNGIRGDYGRSPTRKNESSWPCVAGSTGNVRASPEKFEGGITCPALTISANGTGGIGKSGIKKRRKL